MSEFDLTPEERAMLAAVGALVDERLEPRSAEIDASAEFPLDFYREVGALGFFATFVPEEYGGVEVSSRTTLLAVERMARSSAAVALSFGNAGDAVRPILLGGSEALKKQVLPSIAAGEAIPCFALTEAESGSDAAGMKTRARRDGDSYVIDGQKIYITNGSYGDYFTVFARTSDDARSGVSAFVVPRDAQGFSFGRNEELLGLRGMPATSLNFDAVRIPADWRLGGEGEGFKLAMAALDEARLNISAVSLGLARRALDEAVTFAKGRRSFGKPIIEHQGLGFLLAELAAELAAAWTLFDRAVDVFSNRPSRAASAVVSMAKLAATGAAMRISTEAVQVHGGAGLTRDYPAERFFRDAKAFQILDGTTQIQQLIIARHLNREAFPYAELNW
ncbi:acyl-CoA dehydrogenase family protein [Mycolicibacterium baixiangningiae]|uniref:acyl-CoA dehydrogenase family protein n=1 Tax=Mycolicibacterium baixiangningiae TaxID=2761578 RepID=UPI0018689228|nr:acyl-CoA dehydrogenase family protein [Mycolicibacterium baixiangningiae]